MRVVILVVISIIVGITPAYAQTIEEFDVLSSGMAKTYMSYKRITNESSAQYQYIFVDKEVSVCEDGFLRTDDDYVAVALGSYFGDIGSKFIFTLDSGIKLRLVKAESKADEHTKKGFYQKYDGSVIEFLVDIDKMQDKVHDNGYIYSGNFNNCEDFKGNIVKIEKIIE